MELTAGGKTLAELKIQMALNYILRKCTKDYKFTKSRKRINHLMYVDDKLFTKIKMNWRLLYK